MHTPEQITYIMQELGLDSNSAEARKVVERLAAAKPNVPIDDRFISLLRQDIQSQAANFTTEPKSNNLIAKFMNKVLASALVVALVLVGGSLWYIQSTDQPLFRSQSGEADQILSGKYGVTNAEEESFGDLAKVAIVANGRGGSNSSSANMAQLDAANPSLSSAEKEAIANGNNPVADSKLIAPGEPYPANPNYVFKYNGADLPQVADSQGVLKRIKPVQPPSLVSRIISMLSFGLIDLSKFEDVKIQNFSFVEDREYGYGVGVDFIAGSVNIYQNWEKWPQPYGDVKCMGMEVCPQQAPMTLEELPSDEEAIQIADQFLADYSVSKEGYGAPVINDYWRVYYDRATDKNNYYIPDQVQVTYPLMLEGKAVYDEGGTLSGMSVMVDARTKRATGLSELTTKQFEQSQYKGETSSKRILEIAERGGFRNYPYADPNVKTKTTLELDTPTVEMVKIWYSADNYRSNNELFVPAFVFPIKNWEKTGYWRKNVIVPLVTDILNSDQNYGQPIPLDAPMPVEPDGGNGSSGSSPSSGAATEPAVMPEARG
jgi:hypothetical protein